MHYFYPIITINLSRLQQYRKGRNMKKRKSKINVKMVGSLLVLIGFVFIGMMGNAGLYGFWQVFFDEAIFLEFTITTILIVCLTSIGKDFLRGIKIAFVMKEDYSRMTLQKSIQAVKDTQKIILLEVGVYALIGLINLLYQMHETATIGPAIAWVLRSCLFVSIFELILSFISSRLENLCISYMEDREEESITDEQTLYFKLRGLGLTDREAEVARLITEGYSNKNISEMLYISEATVKKHVTHILEKTKASDREELVAIIMK